MKKRASDVKVGLFVFVGLVMTSIVIFLIGDERRLFSSAVTFSCKFTDVQGLKEGAPIRMGGIDIGHVSEVGYGSDPLDTVIYVRLSIVRTEAGRIKTDSTARITTKGLLGDKMIEITKGQVRDAVPPGGEIKAEEPEDMLGKVAGMAGKAETTMLNIERLSTELANQELHRDLRQSVASANTLLKGVNEGEGYAKRLLTDKGEADKISHLIGTLDRTSSEMTVTLRTLNGVISRVENGPGFAHDVIYGAGPSKEIAQFGAAAQELATTLKTVRESDSLAHDMLFGGKGNGAEALSNVTAITADLRAIIGDVRKGKGTVGALLVDPSVYDDLKVVLGNVQRNDVLRALVRYSINKDEQVKAPAVPSP
ncbi:MAG: MCE family protein [Polyangiaceae bacterium]|nr:MCE family protein [Polyangiaceae bacterium]